MLFFRLPINEGGCKQGLATCPCPYTQLLLLLSVFSFFYCTFNVLSKGLDF